MDNSSTYIHEFKSKNKVFIWHQLIGLFENGCRHPILLKVISKVPDLDDKEGPDFYQND